MTFTRAIDFAEFPDFYFAMTSAFGTTFDQEEMEADRVVVEFDRALAAFADGRIVGTCLAFSRAVRVPGPQTVTAAGISYVSVGESHRGEGWMYRLIADQLRSCYDRGEALAILFATNGRYYRSTGWGVGAFSSQLMVRKEDLASFSSSSRGLYVNQEFTGAAKRDIIRLYERYYAGRPGCLYRDAKWWERRFFRPSAQRLVAPYHFVVATDPAGSPQAYLVARSATGGERLDRSVVVEAVGFDTDALASCFAECMRTLKVDQASVTLASSDASLLKSLGNEDVAEWSTVPWQWVRLVDIRSALQQRSYTSPFTVVLGVRDDACTWNAGNWRLSVQGGVAECVATTDEADLLMDVRDLASTYFGAMTLAELVRAGRIAVFTSVEHLLAVSASMASDPVPHCPEGF